MIVQHKTDLDIQRDILEEFAWDPQIEPNDCGIEVDDGVVTLTGTVETYAMKVAAERASQHVQGVRAVANNISVRSGATWNDTDTARAVAQALENNLILAGYPIDVAVKNGHVTLTGEVDWNYQRTAAAGSVRYLRGVRDLISLITIKQPSVSAHEVQEGIERALVRAAEVDSHRIRVESGADGHITLTGIAPTYAAKEAAARAAWKAKGVTRVSNLIDVRSL